MGRWLAEAHRLRGDHQQAEEALEETLLIAIDAHDVMRELQLRLDFVLCSTEQQRLEPARQHLARARELMIGDEDWRGVAGRLALSEAVVAAAGDPRDGEGRFEEAVEVFRRFHVPWDQAEAFLLWGRALRQAGDHARAIECLDAATEIYRRMGAGPAWLERVQEARTRS